MARIVVGTYMVRYPLGGMLSWALQYLVGLHRLGHEVYLVEKAMYSDACYDPVRNVMSDDCSYGAAVVDQLLRSHGLPGRWCFVDAEGSYHGLSRTQISDVFRTTDVFVDMGTHGAWMDEASHAGLRVLVDGEPGFTQMKLVKRLEAGETPPHYDHCFTSGLNVGTERSTAPTAGRVWRPLPHPVVIDLFEVSDPPPQAPYTTVMNWRSYDPVEFEGVVYGHKDAAFEDFADLPSRVAVRLELAVSGPSVPRDRLARLGWHVRGGPETTRTVDSFYAFIQGSRGEFSICKQGYVATRTGWLSDRAGAYLASGRPVIQQDTGFGDVIPTGEGLLAVSTLDEAVSAIEAVERDYDRHARAARSVAEEHLSSQRVLSRWLRDLGVE